MFDWFLRRLRAALCTIFCCACSGPILMIVGIVMLVAKNTRNSDIDNWKSAIAIYDAGYRTPMLATAGSVNNVALSNIQQTVTVSGNQENIPTTTSVLLSGTAYPAYQWAWSIAIGQSTPYTFNISTPVQSTTSTSVSCTKSYCTSSCSKSNYYCSSLAQRACSDGDYSGSSSCYSNDGECGTCTRETSLVDVCAPLALRSQNGGGVGGNTSSGGGSNNGSQWVASPNIVGCSYPFTAPGTYGTSSTNSVGIRAISDNDPSISLSRITKGSNNFGMTAEDQKSMGTALLVIGVILSLLIFGVLACLVHKFVLTPRRNGIDPFAYNGSYNNNPNSFNGGFAQPLSNGYGNYNGGMMMGGNVDDNKYAFGSASGPVPYGQPVPPPYGQPGFVQAYGQPQQPIPYGQPQQPTPYGQPQPATPYGQPQPATPYGQPQQPTPYGQPQPATPYGQPQPTPYGQSQPQPTPYRQTQPYGCEPAPMIPGFGLPS